MTSSSPEFFSPYFCSLCTLFMFLKHALHQLIQAQIWLVGHTTNEKLWVIPKRQPYIQRMWHFCCTCPLCSDKTELGTHASLKYLPFFLQKNYCIDTSRTVILFSSRYLLSAKSICPTCKQAIFTTNVPIMVLMRANPFSRNIGRGGVGPKNRDFLALK